MRLQLCTSLLFLCLFTVSENSFAEENTSNQQSDDPIAELIKEADKKEIENANQTFIPDSQASLNDFVEKVIPKKIPDRKLTVGTKVYLGNLEDPRDVKTVYRSPGFNWVSCKQEKDPETNKDYCLEATGWPTQDADMEIIGPPETRVVTDPFTGELVEEVYHHIKFNYTATTAAGLNIPRSGTGYLAESFLTTTKYQPIYGLNLKELQNEISAELKNKAKIINNENPESKIIFENPTGDFCKDEKPAVVKAPKELNYIEKIIIKDKVDFLTQANTIYDSVGQCVTKPATKALTKFPKGNVFDSLVLSGIKTSHKLNMTGEDDKPVTTDDLISIDAMARTLYGEMGQCFNKGMQYPMSVARIIVNRSENEKYKKLFIKGPHSDDKSNIAKVATSPSQFNNWMKKNKNKSNGPLHHSLCPPKTVNEPFWNGNNASSSDVEVWRNAVRIATEAVVYPKKFKRRTDDLKDVYFYTSGMGKFYNSKLIKNKEVGDRPVDNERCIELWTFPTSEKKTAKKTTTDKKRKPASKKSKK